MPLRAGLGLLEKRLGPVEANARSRATLRLQSAVSADIILKIKNRPAASMRRNDQRLSMLRKSDPRPGPVGIMMCQIDGSVRWIIARLQRFQEPQFPQRARLIKLRRKHRRRRRCVRG